MLTRLATRAFLVSLLHFTILLCVSVALVPTASATVTSSTTSVSYSPSVDTSVFTVTFPFVSKDDIKVVKILEATSTGTTLTRGTDYTVTLPQGSVNGSVTTTVAVTSAYTITISRVMQLTQPTSYKNTGRYNARDLENSLDRLTMITQQLNASAGTSGQDAVDTHVGQADPHSQYLLLAGRSGGQTAYGGTGTGENLLLGSNPSGDGKLIFGYTLSIDEANARVGIGTNSPTVELEVVGSATISDDITSPILYGSASSGGDLTLHSTSHATKGNLYFGTSKSTWDETNDYWGIGTLTPTVALDIAAGDVNWSNATGTTLTWGVSAAKTGKMLGSTNLGALNFSASTSAAGSGAAGLIVYGSSHAPSANVLGLYGDQIGFSNENGSTMGYFDYSTDVYQSALIMSAKVLARGNWQTKTATYTAVAPTDCGGIVADSTDNGIITLPAAGSTNVGCRITVLNTAADGAALISIQPNAADAIFGSCTGITGAGAATVVQASGTDNKAWNNTKATQNNGDYTTVVSDGSTGWYIVGCIGEWASTP